MLAAEVRISHALRVSLKVIGLQTNFLAHFGIGGVESADGRHQCFDFALVEQAFLMNRDPRFLRCLVIGI